MNFNKRLEQQLIELSHNTEHNTVIPLIIEYTNLYVECLKLGNCNKETAGTYALNCMLQKYKPQKQVFIDDFDDVNVINPNIQRYKNARE